jgi:hypothetical protein
VSVSFGLTTNMLSVALSTVVRARSSISIRSGATPRSIGIRLAISDSAPSTPSSDNPALGDVPCRVPGDDTTQAFQFFGNPRRISETDMRTLRSVASCVSPKPNCGRDAAIEINLYTFV